MALFWSRVADMTQRTVSVALFGLTLLGLGVLAKGGYDVMERKKERDARKLMEQQSAPNPSKQVGVVLHYSMCLILSFAGDKFRL